MKKPQEIKAFSGEDFFHIFNAISAKKSASTWLCICPPKILNLIHYFASRHNIYMWHVMYPLILY